MESRARRGVVAVATLLFFLVAAVVVVAFSLRLKTPRLETPPLGILYSMDRAGVQQSWQDRLAGRDDTLHQLAKLEAAANQALRRPTLTVTAKSQRPPSGDPHDYLSWADYYWPNPDTPNGMPYVPRDGMKNPAAEAIPDHRNLRQFITDAATLGLAYYLDGQQAYATKAADEIRAWLVTPATRMNPNLAYAQIVPGKAGSGDGVIDAYNLPQVIDGITLIAGSHSLSDDDVRAVRVWFADYLKWLTGPHGSTEADFANNRATWYRAQVVAITAYLGDTTKAADVARQGIKLIDSQIKADGSQPQELQRTNSWDYSVFNEEALLTLALAARTVGVDLFDYRAPNGASLSLSLTYLAPYTLDPQRWPPAGVRQLNAMQPSLLATALAIGRYEYPRDAVIGNASGKVGSPPLAALAFPVRSH